MLTPAAITQRNTKHAPCKSPRQARTEIRAYVTKIHEPCGYQRTQHMIPVSARCPRSWVCQLDEEGVGLTLRLGIGQKVDVLAGTWRYVPAYASDDPVRDICEFRRKKAKGAHYKPAHGQPSCRSR